QLADEVSEELQAQASANGVQNASRRGLQQYLEKERINSKLLKDDNAARWLAAEHHATAVLVGYLRGGPAQKNLHVQLLDTRDFGKKNSKAKRIVEEETLDGLGYPGDLDPSEPFGEPLPLHSRSEVFIASPTTPGRKAVRRKGRDQSS